MEKGLLSVALILLGGVSLAIGQTLELAAPFTDNMILQRQKVVPVWGFDAPGSVVTVAFAGQTQEAVTDKNGDWRVDLEPLAASFEARTFRVSSSHGEAIELQGVLVGEVWFASGQSNMVWPAHKSYCRDLVTELARSEHDIPVREISIDTVSALYPQKRATSDDGWRRAEHASGFSALSLAFAYELYKALDVPVGILLSAHSNTRVEAFAARSAFEAHPDLAEDVALMHLGDPLTPRGKAAFEQYFKDLRAWQAEAGPAAEAGGWIPPRPGLPGIAGMWRGPSQFFNGKIAPVIPYAIRGAIWCQGTSNAKDGKIYAARMAALVRGWREAWEMPEMPFYFTQMQAYGTPNPESLGFADIRQVQHLFFMNNRENVGMVVQTDLNSARPQGIHYANKLHPGMRLARWALAKQYGKDIAYTGPIYAGYRVEDDTVIVSFEAGSLFGGLMVGSKGMAADFGDPEKYVEPARPTPDDALHHFRLLDEDGTWHAAEAVIVGDTVAVRAKDVPNPIGVQYAYNAVPERSNLYNKAGLPATPFAAINGNLLFQEDLKTEAASEKAGEPAERPMLHIANYYRPGVIIQRDKPIPVWGHANAGTAVTVTLGEESRTAVANARQQWTVTFPPIPASATPIALHVEGSNGRRIQVGNILVGDVWYLTGSELLTSEWAHDKRDETAALPEPLPLVREFRRRTKASTYETPRKRRFETGGGRFSSHWLTADFTKPGQGVTMFAYQFAKALDRPGVPQGFITMSSGRGGRSPQQASPLSWTSYAGVKDIKHPAFQERLRELALQYPGSDVARAAVDQYVAAVKADVARILEIDRQGGDLSAGAPLRFPSFPAPGSRGKVSGDMIPTYTYNWCVSPLTPMAVAGVIWVPSPHNIGDDPAHYAAELEIYARSLPQTYGQDPVPFLYAHPSRALVDGIQEPTIPGTKPVVFNAWPKSLRNIARQLAERAP